MRTFQAFRKAIPGKTGCLVVHNIQPTKRRPTKISVQVVEKKVVATHSSGNTAVEKPIRYMDGWFEFEPSHCGGTLEKNNKDKDSWFTIGNLRMKWRSQNAKKHSKRVRPVRESIRRYMFEDIALIS